MSTPLVAFLQMLIKQKGTDLHLSTASVPMIRLQGELCRVEHSPLSAAEMEGIINEITNKAQKNTLLQQRSLDFSIRVNGLGIFRVNAFFQKHGLAAVFRALKESAPTFDELNLPTICKVACGYANGLVLVTGPTGSGKTTTLASMLNYINENERAHILTLEDPIEYHHESKRSMVNQRQLGVHFNDFASALKAALREDPDVILVGEMRDPETMALAITAAETGHLVFATLHTNSAAKAVDRIIDSFPGDQQPQIRTMLSESLRVVLSQKLIPTQQKGMMCLHDILVNTPAVANLIREGKTYQVPSIMQTSKKEGMQLLDTILLEAVTAGLVSGKHAWENANDKNLFLKYAPKEAQSLTQSMRTQVTQATNAKKVS
jgi:twitching motility protein PilT